MAGLFAALAPSGSISILQLFGFDGLDDPKLEGVTHFYIRDRSPDGGKLSVGGVLQDEVASDDLVKIPISELENWSFVASGSTSGVVDETSLNLSQSQTKHIRLITLAKTELTTSDWRN